MTFTIVTKEGKVLQAFVHVTSQADTQSYTISICIHFCTNGWTEDDSNMIETCCQEVM